MRSIQKKTSNYEIGEDYQKVVNYLVYLESFAPLILSDHVHLEKIDDLMGYRYFIAINNPAIQELELKEDGIYYLGCFKIYSIWKDYRIQRGLPIPLEEFGLEKTDIYQDLQKKGYF